MFDVLKDDFDYWFILGTLGILVLVTIVSQRLASIKMLRQAWQWEESPPKLQYALFNVWGTDTGSFMYICGLGWKLIFLKYKYHKISGNIQFT